MSLFWNHVVLLWPPFFTLRPPPRTKGMGPNYEKLKAVFQSCLLFSLCEDLINIEPSGLYKCDIFSFIHVYDSSGVRLGLYSSYNIECKRFIPFVNFAIILDIRASVHSTLYLFIASLKKKAYPSPTFYTNLDPFTHWCLVGKRVISGHKQVFSSDCNETTRTAVMSLLNWR